jgi:hypothetical protein
MKSVNMKSSNFEWPRWTRSGQQKGGPEAIDAQTRPGLVLRQGPVHIRVIKPPEVSVLE